VGFAGLTVQAGPGAYDVGLRSVDGYCVSGTDTQDGALRVHADESTQTCPPSAPTASAATPSTPTPIPDAGEPERP
jgi:hypothetical protein